MRSAALFLKDPAQARYVAGGLAEAQALLGSPLPALPPPETVEGRSAFFVTFRSDLRSQLRRFLDGLLVQIGADDPVKSRPRREAAEREQAEYEAEMGRVLHAARSADRGLGLPNLFWLAHTRDAAESLREMEAKNATIRRLKNSLHPLLSSFYRRLEMASRREFEKAAGDKALGVGEPDGTGLVDALIDDGFAFTELSIADLDFNRFLASNKRYRISADVFFELYQILQRDTERRLREGERGLLSRIARHMPNLSKEQLAEQAGVVKVMMNSEVMAYLLADAWSVGSRITASPKIKSETERRKPAEVVDAFLDLVTGVKRFEIVSLVRDRIALVRDRDIEEKASRGLRLYEFGESAQVVNNAVNATVLFLDLRGFTKSSEGQISERDLTRDLYAVFDAFVPLVARFGGTVDKFLGDGFMVTYGTTHEDPLDPLNAVRTAILCQETLHKMRAAGKTCYRMGVAIHHGRVYLARFLAEEDRVQETVIGRNVNLAGRLSSASLQLTDEGEEISRAEPSRGTGLRVSVEPGGTLVNEGIAISRDTLVQLETHLALVHTDDGTASIMEYFDESIGRRILIRYAGDAKFKGVSSSFPVYGVDYEA